MKTPHRIAPRWARATFVAAVTLLSASAASSQTYINEIYFDPPGSTGDLRSEYIELRGVPDQSLDEHYLIFLENETGTSGVGAGTKQGVIDNLFDLSGVSLGSNGYLTIRQAGNFFPASAAGSNDLVNAGAAFTFGSGTTSTVGHTNEGNTGRIENSGFTAMLIDIGEGSAPTLGQDLDVGDNGMSDDIFPAGWTKLDAIGVNSESSDADGRLYGEINFSSATPSGGGNVEPGALFIDVGFEIEYIARWGNSTGSGVRDWHASNLTDNELAGFAGPADFRQSGTSHDTGGLDNFVESSQGVPYGVNLVASLGGPNLFILDGDFEYDPVTETFDNDVDGGDFLVWQRNFGFEKIDPNDPSDIANDATRRHGDTANPEDGLFDRVVDVQDLAVWASHYGETYTPPSDLLALAMVPEPSALFLLLQACCHAWFTRRLRKFQG